MSEEQRYEMDNLVNLAQPYAVDSFDDALFTASMNEADNWHRQNNANYQSLWQKMPQPVIPVNLFKTMDLATPTHRNGIWLNSSGTGQQGKTQVFFDDVSLKHIETAMTQIFYHNGLISTTPARFLMLSPDPQSGDHAGFATAFLKFTQCAPIKELVFTVSEHGQFDTKLAWSTLQRWANDPAPIYILGLTLFFEHLCLSRPDAFTLLSPIKGLTGGGWKGMTKQLERPDIIQGLKETLHAPNVDIRDIYGMTEHPLHYISCSEGHFHIPAYSRFAIIDETGDRAPERKVGFIQLENPFFDSLASQRLLTQDLGLWGTQCACGHPLPYIHYIGRATSPEGTCAAQVK
ncbi:hypothetical protein CEP63_016980 [Proteus mirabilis]|nr:hypothetical protein CEP63_016980 [Proteus mirabilis]